MLQTHWIVQLRERSPVLSFFFLDAQTGGRPSTRGRLEVFTLAHKGVEKRTDDCRASPLSYTFTQAFPNQGQNTSPPEQRTKTYARHREALWRSVESWLPAKTRSPAHCQVWHFRALLSDWRRVWWHPTFSYFRSFALPTRTTAAPASEPTCIVSSYFKCALGGDLYLASWRKTEFHKGGLRVAISRGETGQTIIVFRWKLKCR